MQSMFMHAGNAAEDPAHNELRALNKRVVDAFNKRDVNAIIKELDEKVVFTTMNSDVVRGRDKIKGYFDKMMTGDKRVVDSVQISFRPDALTELYFNNTGVVTGDSIGKFKLTSGLNFTVKARWTATLVKQGNAWKVAGFHYSTNMFDNPILDDITNTYLIIGIVAALLMLFIGIFVGRWSKR